MQVYRRMLNAKIHRARITQTDLQYEGSVVVDQDLLDTAGILPYEKVEIVNNNNGQRIETYCISGERGSGIVCLNGAAARSAQPGDIVILMAYVQVEESRARGWKPTVVLVDERNRIRKGSVKASARRGG